MAHYSKRYHRQKAKENHEVDKKIRQLYRDPNVSDITFTDFKKKYKKTKAFNLFMLLMLCFEIGYLLPNI